MNNIFNHTPTSNELLEEIRKSLSKHISGNRLSHTMFVEKEALAIAQILFPYLGIDCKYFTDISASALLHDITKQKSSDYHKSICNEFSIAFDKNDAVLHSRTGAYEAKRIFPINDIVFGAIYCHTTGKKDMNIFEKIIFIADYIEESRLHPSCKQARDFFYDNINLTDDKLLVLNKTILISIDSTIRFLLDKQSAIDIETINARNSIIDELFYNSEV